MEEQSYYYYDRNFSNRKSTEKPLLVNCAGCQHCYRIFDTSNRNARKDYYLQYMTDGKMTVTPDDVIKPFRAGDFIIWEAGSPHNYAHLTDDPAAYLWVHFTGFHAGHMLSDIGLATNRLYHTNSSKKTLDGIFTLFSALFEEFTNRRPGTEEAMAGLLTGILVTLMREADKVNVGKSRKLTTVSYLHLHFTENTPISKLAQMEHLSGSRYREVFKRHTGLSPVDYRTALRISNACRLLLQTDHTVAEIAADCGYSDVFFFMRIFKQKTGLPPGEYRISEGMRRE